MKKEIDEFVDLCKKELGKNLISVILFGSYAEGKQTKMSDFDFYVVVKRNDEKKKKEIINKFKWDCDLIMRTKGNINYYLENLNALDMEVISKGKKVYGKNLITEHKPLLNKIKKKYNLISEEKLGKGVWKIGTAS
ncbi:MAG: nucleotidyltransferase domain-containing protein [Nanoarchaeota archaeon]|nr:nucleotidyltransferase domain-containing protein [Nanoarchaeota archaeon]MBU1622274.1 nucleotidyltransferase domain-containing protein [Nanoarchaeota archaeon]MBU1973781.1 nucleotidyltransferase domain-containing protein [Nanoarchaeota archaeon]